MEWSKKPLHTIIYSIIESKKNILFNELIKEVREILDNVSESEVRNILMKLEIWKKIAVETEGNTCRIILRGD